MAENLTLRVAGLGHSVTFEVSPTATVADVKEEVEKQTFLPLGYQRLLARGKKLDNDEATLESVGIKNRTRLMLLHNELYASHRESVDTISAILKETAELASKTDDSGIASPEVIREFVTRICCRLDGVDTHGSASLRAMRKKAILKAEALDKPSKSSNLQD